MIKRIIWGLSVVMAALLIAPSQLHAQSFDPQVEALLDDMSPEERVGQLMIVTFFGTDVSPQSDIAQLIRDYHIGGVMIRPTNNNLTSEANLALELNTLTRQLQSVNRDTDPTDDDATPADPYVPLFIAADLASPEWHALTEVSPDLTPLPSALAIGATWQPARAYDVGEVAGQELSALGINLAFGPLADVVVTPPTQPAGDLGTRVFGGDPYWVGEMTAHYVAGLHDGSQGALLVAPRHFPGYGSADRLAQVEIPNVQRTLEQLDQVDLVPFYRVTGGAETAAQQADALVTGHIVYRGLQTEGSRPISLDPNALNTLLSQPQIEPWVADGGLIISDALGLRGVQLEYGYQPGTPYPNRQIALEAFEAGNDLLYLGNFGANPPADQTDTIVDTLQLFVDRYEQDVEFRERTDEAVRRILTKKLELYNGSFRETSVLPAQLGEGDLQNELVVAFNVANSGLTLLAPQSAEELRVPQSGEQIVIFSDIRSFSQCATCTARSLIGAGELQASILRLYGPQGSNTLGFADISSYTFDQLAQFLEFGPGGSTGSGAQDGLDDLAVSLDNADWVIIAMQDQNTTDYAAASAVSEFLAQQPVGFDTRIVVIAAGAPYYLDATEVSKLSAYYALYDTSSPFIDVVATALFRQQSLIGDSPVSVPGIDYDIETVTQPDPTQVIPLVWRKVEETDPDGRTATPAAISPQASPAPVAVGEQILVQATVEDVNGRPVKDGTPVIFEVNYVAAGEVETFDATTMNGMAELLFTRDRDSLIVIEALSPPATESLGIRMDEFSIGVVTPQPTIVVTEEPQPTATPAPPDATAEPEDTAPLPENMVGFDDLFFTMLGLTAISVAIFILTVLRQDLNTALLMALPPMIIGIVAYNYYALQLPGALPWRRVLLGINGNPLWAAGSAAWLAAGVAFGLIRITLVLINRGGSPALKQQQASRDGSRE